MTARYSRSDIENAFPGGRWQPDGEYLVRSPLREERTASFRINIEKGAWKDFGSDEGGKLSDLFKMLGVADPWQGNQPSWQEPVIHYEKILSSADQERSKKAKALWEESKPTDGHNYLKRKKISIEGLRVDTEGNLLIPGYGIDGRIISVERISAKGEKRHLGPKQGAFFPVGDFKGDSPIILLEGAATAVSANQITEWPAIGCFGTAGLLPVAELFQKRYPGRQIVISPDNDESGHRAGREARAAGFKVVTLPEDSRRGFDWNDLLCEHGFEAAKDIFKEQWAAALEAARSESPEPEKPKIDVLSLVEAPSPETAVKPEKVWHFPRKHLNLVAADPGMGKSILLTKVSCDLSLGEPVLGMMDEPVRKILFLNGECGRDYFNWRFRASGWAFSKERFKVLHQEKLAEKGVDLDLDSLAGRRNLEAILDNRSPDLLIIDSLPAFSNEDLNDGQAQNELGKYLKTLAIRYNLALVLVTHLRKRRLQDQGTEPTLSEIQGSNAVAKLCNVALAVYEQKIEDENGDERIIKVCKSVKTWGPKVAAFGFTFPELSDDELAIQMEEIPERNKRLQGTWERVRAALHGTEFSRAAVENVAGVSDKTAKNLLAGWMQQGKVEKFGRGKNTTYRIRGSDREEGESLVSNGHSGKAVHIFPRMSANPVIATNESGKSTFPESEPQGGNDSGKVSFPESNTVISMVYDDSGKYREGGVPNEPDTSTLADMSPALSVAQIAARAGVGTEAVLEELGRWQDCGRLSVDGAGGIILLAGDAFPGDGGPDDDEGPDDPPEQEPEPALLGQGGQGSGIAGRQDEEPGADLPGPDASVEEWNKYFGVIDDEG
jgi:hypothetical protein